MALDAGFDVYGACTGVGETVARKRVALLAVLRSRAIVYADGDTCMQALPTCKAEPGSHQFATEQSCIWLESGEVCFKMLRRENRAKGSGVLRRRCSCEGGATSMCAAHTLWEQFFAQLPAGAKPWARITANHARDRLRTLLRKLCVPDAESYGTHDFGRGHAEASPCFAFSSYCLRVLLSGHEAIRLHPGADSGRRPVEVQGFLEILGRGQPLPGIVLRTPRCAPRRRQTWRRMWPLPSPCRATKRSGSNDSS